MKLLFDNNISYKLVVRLQDIFPESTHVMLENLDEASDNEIWKFAQQYHFTIVTKDNDFNTLSVLNGFPPKVIWIQVGNCKVADLEKIIRNHFAAILTFYNQDKVGILEID